MSKSSSSTFMAANAMWLLANVFLIPRYASDRRTSQTSGLRSGLIFSETLTGGLGLLWQPRSSTRASPILFGLHLAGLTKSASNDIGRGTG